MISSALAQERPNNAKKSAPGNITSDLQKINAAIESKQQEITAQQTDSQAATWWTTTSAMTMSATVLLFGFLTLCLAAYVIRRGHAWEAVLKIFGMVLIIVLTVFLIVAGYDDKQIAPAVGLLGTIAGYLLGKEVTPVLRTQAPAAGPAPGTPGSPQVKSGAPGTS